MKNGRIPALVRFPFYFTALAVIVTVILWLLCRYGFSRVMSDGHGSAALKESGVVEWLEFLGLCLTSLFLFLAARRTTEYPALFPVLALLPLIAGFREVDGVLDHIFHGAWRVPASTIAMLVFYRIFKTRGQLAAEAPRFAQTQQVVFFGIGLFIVVISAQLSGRQAVWHTVLGEHYVRKVGRFMEEYQEFLGYLILVIGSIECYLSARRTRAE